MESKTALKIYRTRLNDKGKIVASWRSVSFIMEGYENQLTGMDLCIEAMKRLQNMTEEEKLLYGPLEHVEELRE